VVVLMRGGGRRCVWPVDDASGLSARVLEKTVQEMGWPGRREGCGWDVVVVVYVGGTVHVRASQLQAPTHRPKVRCHSKRVLGRVSSTQRDALDAGCEASYSGGRRPTELIDPSTHPPTPQTRHQPKDRVWPGAAQGCVGNEWGVVVVVYVEETVHQSAPQLQAPTHGPREAT
jgi:hypothetical protein